MIKRPLLLGAAGSMGRRYAAILAYLGVDFLPVDVGDSFPNDGGFDGVIIATPTALHCHHIRKVWGFRVPILSEKAISTDLGEVFYLCRDAERDGVRLKMVNQYAYISSRGREGVDGTSYDYWRSGGDGLAWDCINLIGLARGQVTLANRSPLWTCSVNGEVLNLADMDGAYVKMIKSWLGGDVDGLDYIRSAHLKVVEYLKTHG